MPRSLSSLATYDGIERAERRRSAGKSLFELVVVLAIIATLIGMYVPAALNVLKALDRFR